MSASGLPGPPGPGAALPPPRLQLGATGLWRVWHPGRHTRQATALRSYGPLARFDPHPLTAGGRPGDHGEAGPSVIYGSLLFDTAVRERLARGVELVDVCPGMRGSLLATVDDVSVHDLADEGVCAELGASTELGDDLGAHVYATTQRWARHLRPGSAGMRYFSARHRNDDGSRHGINVALWQPGTIDRVVGQHRLIDDVLWPHVIAALDAAGVAVNRVPSCPSCDASPT